MDGEGIHCSSAEDIAYGFTRYFQQLFTTSSPSGISNFLAGLHTRVNEAMNLELTKELTFEEISLAISNMASLKSPGPDGFPVCFYVENWDTVGVEVCRVVSNFFTTGHLDEAINFTHIALIPKRQHPTSVIEFRPISLCNVLYKIIAKTLANRLKKVVPHIISLNQSAFVPGRLISDYVLAAYETLHSMHMRMWGKVGYVALKLDMSKAYDKVEWVFLEEVMKKMEFDGKWIRLIMSCISTVRYSILINGVPKGCIRLTRGIR